MLCDNFVEPGHSKWASPIVFAQENDRLLLFSITSRHFNVKTVKEHILDRAITRAVGLAGRSSHIFGARRQL